MDVKKSLLGVVFIISFSACSNTKTPQSVMSDSDNLSSKLCAGQKILTRYIVQWEDGRFSVENGHNDDEFMQNFVEPKLAGIKKVEHDRIITLDTPTVTESVGSDEMWGQYKIQADQIWSNGQTGQGVLVGVVDAQVDVKHPQLIHQIAYNTGEIPDNGIDDDGNGFVDDYAGQSFVSSPSSTSTAQNPHGTHVAGIIAAEPGPTYPMQGVAPGVKIIPSAFISDSGSGTLGDAIMAMQYAVSRGAKIINASWGGAPCVSSLRNAFVELEKSGVLIVVAAGNSGHDLDRFPEYPASFNLSNQITVGAANSADFMTSWSNSSFSQVGLVAPGAAILSTTPNGTYQYLDGTSMAAPFVAAAAASLWGAHPSATLSQIKNALLKSVDVNTINPYRVQTGGRLNLLKAHQLLGN